MKFLCKVVILFICVLFSADDNLYSEDITYGKSNFIEYSNLDFDARYISGKVTDQNNNPISNVSVSDGFSVVRTNNYGDYKIKINPKSRFITITVPSNYELPHKNGIACGFYKKINKSIQKDYNFQLKERGNAHNPSINNPSTHNSSINNSSINNPSTHNSSINNASTNNPSINNPSINNPSINNPSINNPSINNPSINNPSTNNPSINNSDNNSKFLYIAISDPQVRNNKDMERYKNETIEDVKS